ncbi:MAG: hydroxyethylthiazole kinase [Agathobacter sp.]
MDNLTPRYLGDLIKKVNVEKPLVHCITNMVTINDCANILLAVGASPTMAHHPSEVEEIATQAHSLVLNMGATESLEAMFLAGKAASAAGKPIIIDPVGAAGAGFRRRSTLELISAVHPTCIRGNLSEIQALATNQTIQMGVDARNTGIDISNETIDLIKSFAKQTGAIVVASGITDIITDGNVLFTISDGSPMMARITGSGCMSSALLGAFLGVNFSIEAVASSCKIMGICGEIAEEKAMKQKGGTMTFRNLLIDTMYVLDEKMICNKS